jgi:hypothetical protein
LEFNKARWILARPLFKGTNDVHGLFSQHALERNNRSQPEDEVRQMHRPGEQTSLLLNVVKVKLSLCLTKHHATKTYWRVKVQLHVFLSSALDGSEW